MSQRLLNSRDMDFLLYEFLDTESLVERPQYAEHSREVFDASIETARTIAEKFFADHNAKGDANEPQFDGEKVTLIPETREAWNAVAEAGFMAAHYDFESGGMQLPEVVFRTAMAYFTAANVSTTAYVFLTIGAANLIEEFGSEEQRSKFLPPMQDGRFSGTMVLTEPGQGSSLGDMKTRATPAEDGTYRIFGQKMYISGGDHDLTDNIVHMVLAKIDGSPPGAKGISLFICPKFLVNEDGSTGERNDVALAGLLHKMGYRNTTSTVLSFGEKEGAVGYLVGEPNRGLQYMFQMMNEARIGVGLGAGILGYQGYNYSLDYARERPQGRLPSNKNPESAQVPIVEHADVKRMLLAQKAYSEGSVALCLYASQLFDDSKTAATEEGRQDAFLLLDLITPVVKSFPSKYGLMANELAVQVLGGCGYTREYPVEQYYRDNRLNPIHEGTEGIHGIDILGRKVQLKNGRGMALFNEAVEATLAEANSFPELAAMAESLGAALQRLNHVTEFLTARMGEDVDLALANATVYLDVFGRITASWIWLKQAIIATAALNKGGLAENDQSFYSGKLQATRYYLQWELPAIGPQVDLLLSCDSTTLDMQDAWF